MVKPKLRQAAEKARSMLEAGILDTEGVVHSVRNCAESWNVSTVTAHGVLKELAAENLVRKDSLRGRFVVVGREPPVPDTVERRPAVSRHRYISEVLREEIVSGRFDPPFGFPIVAELCGRFSCSYYTLVRGLETLQKEGLLVRKGRKYAVNRSSSPDSSRSRLCIMGRQKSLIDPFQSIFINATEQALLSSAGGTCRRIWSAEFSLPADTLPSGFLLLTPELYTRSVAALEYPVVVLNQPEEPLPGMPAHHTVVGPDNEAASRTVADHLAFHGHRRIAFFSQLKPFAGHHWVDKRLAGLQTLFPTEKSHTSRRMDIVIQTEDLSSPDNLTGKRTAMRDAIGSLTRNQKWEQYVPENVTQKIFFRSADQVLNISNLGNAFEPHFRRIMEDTEISAWVCLNDQLAAVAFQFLSRVNIHRRENVALISFDNSSPAQLLGFTSYDFRYDKMGRLAVQYFLHPEMRPSRRENRVTAVGELVERLSMG